MPRPPCLDPSSFCRSSNQEDHRPNMESHSLEVYFCLAVFPCRSVCACMSLLVSHMRRPLPGPIIILSKQQTGRAWSTHRKPCPRTIFLLGCVSLWICLCVYVFLCSSYAPTPAWLDPPSFCRSSNQQDHGPLTPSASLSSRTLPLFLYLSKQGERERNSEIFLVMA